MFGCAPDFWQRNLLFIDKFVAKAKIANCKISKLFLKFPVFCTTSFSWCSFTMWFASWSGLTFQRRRVAPMSNSFLSFQSSTRTSLITSNFSDQMLLHFVIHTFETRCECESLDAFLSATPRDLHLLLSVWHYRRLGVPVFLWETSCRTLDHSDCFWRFSHIQQISR